jgi:lipopolysaccharide transport protein LptA
LAKLAVLLLGGWLTAVALAASAALHPAAVAPHGPGPTGPAPQQSIVIDAAFSHVDYKTDTVEFKNVAVSQGNTGVTAERAHATGVGFANSQWTFEGSVLIVLEPRGTLRSDQAVVQFRNSRVTRATATGKPATFEQRTGSRGALRAHANQIVYNAENDSVRLSGDAWLSDGRVEISGPALVYNVRDEQLQAASRGERRRIHITVTPQALRKKGEGAPVRRSLPPPRGP